MGRLPKTATVQASTKRAGWQRLLSFLLLTTALSDQPYSIRSELAIIRCDGLLKEAVAVDRARVFSLLHKHRSVLIGANISL